MSARRRIGADDASACAHAIIGSRSARLARNSNCAILGERPSALPDPWTIHSLMLFVPGPASDEMWVALRSFTPAPLIFGKNSTDRQTGESITLSRLIRLDFADPANAALLPLEAVAASLRLFPWGYCPGLRINRVDLVADHLVAANPKEVCDRIAGLRLPYSRPYRGPRDADEPWLSIYHNGGKARAPRIVVIHYPRLASLLRRHAEAGTAARRYAEHRVRQEVRFRGQGLRRAAGGGPMTPDVVFGSFAALVQFAERRLRPVFEAGILSTPPRDLAGEAALASAVGYGPRPANSMRPSMRLPAGGH